jgi:murein DD-endopeptidase MepM/ murein hydrolase activator NlpD
LWHIRVVASTPMGWGNYRYHWARVVVGLVIALLASAGAVVIFVVGVNDDAHHAAVQHPMVAGRIEPEYIDEPTEVAPAPDPITISLTLDRSARVLWYLEEAGLDRNEAQRWAHSFAKAGAGAYLRRGHVLTLLKDPENGSLRELKYNLDENVAVRAETYGSGVIRSSKELISYVVRPVAVSFKLDGSFWQAAKNHDLPRPIVASLEKAFKDQHPLSKLPRGSAVKLIYRERVSRDGTSRTPAGLDAAQISFGKKTLSAFSFRGEKGEAHLYSASGEALEPQSLRFPLKFQYISSGFTFHRYHPILHKYRAHLGVDLAAHYGTRVKAISDGRIESAGWCGELGRCVKIQHSGGIVSIYGHLSRITRGLHPGSPVRIGEVIGRVGSSGLSTGPHLHFAIEKHGHFVNPLTQSLGVHHEIPPRMRTMFKRIQQKYVAVLNRLPKFGGHLSLTHPVVAPAKGAAGVSRAAAPATDHQAGHVQTIAAGTVGIPAR